MSRGQSAGTAPSARPALTGELGIRDPDFRTWPSHEALRFLPQWSATRTKPENTAPLTATGVPEKRARTGVARTDLFC